MAGGGERAQAGRGNAGQVVAGGRKVRLAGDGGVGGGRTVGADRGDVQHPGQRGGVGRLRRAGVRPTDRTGRRFCGGDHNHVSVLGIGDRCTQRARVGGGADRHGDDSRGSVYRGADSGGQRRRIDLAGVVGDPDRQHPRRGSHAGEPGAGDRAGGQQTRDKRAVPGTVSVRAGAGHDVGAASHRTGQGGSNGAHAGVHDSDHCRLPAGQHPGPVGAQAALCPGNHGVGDGCGPGALAAHRRPDGTGGPAGIPGRS